MITQTRRCAVEQSNGCSWFWRRGMAPLCSLAPVIGLLNSTFWSSCLQMFFLYPVTFNLVNDMPTICVMFQFKIFHFYCCFILACCLLKFNIIFRCCLHIAVSVVFQYCFHIAVSIIFSVLLAYSSKYHFSVLFLLVY